MEFLVEKRNRFCILLSRGVETSWKQREKEEENIYRYIDNYFFELKGNKQSIKSLTHSLKHRQEQWFNFQDFVNVLRDP